MGIRDDDRHGDPATQNPNARFFADYTQFLDPNGLRGARLGIARTTGFGNSPKTDVIMEEAIRAMRTAGAVIVDPANIPTQAQLGGATSLTVLLFEFKQNLNTYLATRTGVPIQTLADAIAFNDAHAAQELKYFGQELFLQSQATTSLDDPVYVAALARSLALSRQQGIDQVMTDLQLDALVAPTGGPAGLTDLVDGDRGVTSSSTPAAQAGYPIVTVPAGLSFELPVNVSFIGRAFSEPKLISIAFAFEQATKARRAPKFIPALPLPLPS